MLLIYCLDYCSFVLNVKVRSPSVLFFFKIILDILDSLNFHINFRVSLVTGGIMIGILLNL